MAIFKDSERFLPLLLWVACCASHANDGVSLYREGRFEEAKQLLEVVAVDAESRRWLGLTYFQLLEYSLALPLLQQTLAEQPNDTVIRRALGELHLERRDLEIARQTVLPLVQGDANNQDWFLWGRIQEALGAFDEADQAYRMALETTDAALYQAVAVQMGQFYLREDRILEVQPIIAAAEALDPTSLDAETLRAMRVRTFAEGETARAIDGQLGYQLIYDDNVALAPNRDVRVGQDGNQGDFRHLFYGDLRGRQDLGHGVTLFGEAHLAHGMHSDLDEFDFTRQNYVASLGWDGPLFGVRLPVEWLRIDEDSDRLLSRWSISPGVYYRFNESTQLYGYFRYDDNDYNEDRSIFDSEERSGNTRTVGALLQWRGFEGRAQLRSLVEFGDDDTDGDNWQRERLRLYLYGEYQLNPRVLMALGGEYLRDDYDNRHDLLGEVREDRIAAVFGLVNYQLSSRWSLQMRFAHESADSNLDAYDYDRTVVSAGVNWRF